MEKNELIRALVDAKLFRGNVCDRIEVRPCLLEQDHMERAHQTVRHFAAFQLKMERRV